MTATDTAHLYELHPMPPRGKRELFRVGSWIWFYEKAEAAVAAARPFDEFGSEHVFYASGPTVEQAQEAALAYVRESYDLRLRPYAMNAQARWDDNNSGEGDIIDFAGEGIAEREDELHLITDPAPLTPGEQVYCLSAKTWRYTERGEESVDGRVNSTTLLAVSSSRDEIITLRDHVAKHSRDVYPSSIYGDGRMLPFLDRDINLEKLEITRVDVI